MSDSTTVSRSALWTGRIVSTLLVLFLLFDAVGKLLMLQPVIEASAKLGYPESTIFGIGLSLLIATLLYIVPRTAVLGAILLTAYLGGATASQVRVLDPWFLFPVGFGILVWLGLYLRDRRLRTLIPLRSESPQGGNDA